MNTQEKGRQIIQDIVSEKGNNPARIFKKIAKKDYISIHGPEHHILDGASILVAFYNAVEYINTYYDVKLDYEKQQPCEFSGANQQCIKENCPFYVDSSQRNGPLPIQY